MNSNVMWAIDPNNKPSTRELRDAFAELDDRHIRRRRTYGYSAEKIGSISIVPIRGALYTSDYHRISAMINEANLDSDISTILLDINSPGGMVIGSIECASIIKKSEKPVYSYIEGMGASAAYLLASASKEIIMSRASETGSIGVQASWTNTEGLFAKLGVQKVYFHSKFSDKKNLSPSTKEGAAAVKKLLDETWDIFSSVIAKNRGISIDYLTEKYGQGEVFMASEAIERGLADEIVDDFDACVDKLKPQSWGEGEGMAQDEITTVEALTAAYPELVAQIKRDERKAGVDEGVASERKRAEAIVALGKHTDDSDLLANGIKEGKTTEAVMSEILNAQVADREKAEKEANSALEEAEKKSAQAAVTPASLPSDGTVSDEAKAKKRVDEMCKNMEVAE